ncbi:MAG: sporulation protein [Crocinitomicaceae bacterium]|nr:sporulation protein [Crocinitomicaceae bacterium]
MGLWDKIKSNVGIGQPKVELVLDTNMIAMGGQVTCTINITGGTRELPMKEVGITINQIQKYKDGDGKPKTDTNRVLKHALPLDGQLLEVEGSASFELPINIPEKILPSEKNLKYEIRGWLDIPGMDASQKHDLTILYANKNLDNIKDKLDDMMNS